MDFNQKKVISVAQKSLSSQNWEESLYGDIANIAYQVFHKGGFIIKLEFPIGSQNF